MVREIRVIFASFNCERRAWQHQSTDKARLDEYKSSPPPAPRAGSGASQETGLSQADPYEEAKSDPVVQDLLRRGGKVTDVELLE